VPAAFRDLSSADPEVEKAAPLPGLKAKAGRGRRSS